MSSKQQLIKAACLSLALTNICYMPNALAAAPAFDSGSQGTKDLICTSGHKILKLDASGVKHYRSINIGRDCTLSFTPTGNGLGRHSVPVRLIVKNNVLIEGTINLNGSKGGDTTEFQAGQGGIGGPGGYDGGAGGWCEGDHGRSGFGPGGGQGGFSTYSKAMGNKGVLAILAPISANYLMQPLIGGSGGGGGYGLIYDGRPCGSGGGGGGGGALFIAASGNIQISGFISAVGGQGGIGIAEDSYSSGGGNGAMGMVRMIANKITGTGRIEALTILEAEHIDVTGLTVTGAVYKSPLTRRTLNIQQEPALEITHIGRNRVTNGRIYIDKPGTTRISFKVKGMKLSKNIQLIIAVQGITPDSKKEVVAKVNPNGTGWADVEVVPGVNLITAYFKFKK
ncbi:hypothetical protein TI05_07300 [Achromatium sp. WMS3]|nr:hypothetical protein TI05_07300 [Achromatium sp. WMS3]